MASKRLQYLMTNPNATFDEFAKETGGSKQQWYSTKYEIKRKERVAKAKNDKKKAEAKQARIEKKGKLIDLGPIGGAEQKSNQITNLHRQIISLESDIRGYRIVISYLEHQLGLKQSGPSV